jgi:natural product biosynthesis luciferase-like monooxygenase protein
LFWTLARGFRVVLYRDRGREAARVAARKGPVRSIDFSLFYFASDEPAPGEDKYDLLLSGAKFADEHGFRAVWTPERHFHAFGGLYPNPAVTGAALAVLTENVQIRAGSVVLPLHHPVRVAEAWSVVDNLSHGRVGISFASGWQPNDFVLRPESFNDAKAVMFRDIEVVKALWRGDAVSFPGPNGPVAVRTLPRPVQSELPVWVTTAGNVDTYRRAGQIGANVLTHLLGQSIDDLAPKIGAYRAARREHGHDPDLGVVSLMLHTYVGEDEEELRKSARGPLKRYLASSLDLLQHYAWAFPAFSRPTDVSADRGDDLASLSEEERDALLEHAFARYYETSGLFGRPAECLARIEQLREIGVDEVACLVDFGIPKGDALAHLSDLARLRDLSAKSHRLSGVDLTIAAQLERFQVTHLQCTPSMARMLLDDDQARAGLARLECFLVGGESLGADLAQALRAATSAAIIDVYGPTETTVWSTTHRITEEEGDIPIGRPLANTRVYVLDARRQPLPPMVPGELFIGGDGVARGYLGRRELTSERFVPDPFARSGRMYRTGDVARFREDGILEFRGRLDTQVKIRGHRVELGEIETAIFRHETVRQCVVVLREDVPFDQRLVAYVVGKEAGLEGAKLRAWLADRLPDFMVPSHVVVLSELPETPNRKIDRKALPAPEVAAAPMSTPYVPKNDIELSVVELWKEILGREHLGADDNFFDVGGHSLLLVRMHRKLCELSPRKVTLTDLYRFPTIRSLTDFLSESPGKETEETAQKARDRAERRREMFPRRRTRLTES